jgi:hypothetical protein
MAGDSQRMVRLLQNLTEQTHHQEAKNFCACKFEHPGLNNKAKLERSSAKLNKK